jgi:hypothetical protein
LEEIRFLPDLVQRLEKGVKATLFLGWVVERLRRRYGVVDLPPTSDPFELILWENIAYLASPEKKRLAFEMLRNSIGCTPRQIIEASNRDLRDVVSFGILRDTAAAKLRECAHRRGVVCRGRGESARRAASCLAGPAAAVSGDGQAGRRPRPAVRRHAV